MITRDDVRELARFQAEKQQDCALSFYYVPQTPQDKSHRQEVILAKDLVKNALQEAERAGKNGCVRADLDRILQLAESLYGNQARGKAVFACGNRNFWREFDVPLQLSKSQLFVNRRFRLRPLAQLLGAQQRLWVALVDRQKARFFDLRLDELTELEGLFRTLPLRQGRSDGFAGYEGGHAQRRVQDEALHHLKDVAEHLRESSEKGMFETLIIGCHDTAWRELESQLHPYVKKRLLGHFSAEVSKMTTEQIREQATRVLKESSDQRRRELVGEVLNQAKSNNHGVTGLRRVLRSLELGEVQVLLLGDNFARAAAECPSCGHIDAHPVHLCPACGRETREIEDVCDAIIPIAIQRDIEVLYIRDDPEFDAAGNIAALLRFRADQSKGQLLQAAS